MDLNQSLDPSAVTAISAAIGHLREVSATLTATEPGARLPEAHFAVMRVVEDKVWASSIEARAIGPDSSSAGDRPTAS